MMAAALARFYLEGSWVQAPRPLGAQLHTLPPPINQGMPDERGQVLKTGMTLGCRPGRQHWVEARPGSPPLSSREKARQTGQHLLSMCGV